MNRAEGGTRTPTGLPATPSRWCVYQFHHFGIFFFIHAGMYYSCAAGYPVPVRELRAWPLEQPAAQPPDRVLSQRRA